MMPWYTIEDEDYIDIQLTEKEIKRLLEYEAVSEDFPAALSDFKDLNVIIRRTNNASKKGI